MISIYTKKLLPGVDEYLETIAANFTQGSTPEPGLRIFRSVEESNDIAETLITIAERGNLMDTTPACHLLALTTHSRSGLLCLMTGSVTEQVLSKAHLPLLIMNPSIATSQDA
jgi:nucleotide-binding universal stress UspA family protein